MFTGKHLILLVVAASLVVPGSCNAEDEIGVMTNADAFQITPTYDGSGQVTEPSILEFPGEWHGFRYWLVVAPYPHSNDLDENPSILTSQDGLHWSAPPGIENPLEKPSA